MITLPRPDVKLCKTCGRTRPVDEFRSAAKGRKYLVPDCRRCHANYERERLRAKRERERQGELKKNLTVIVNAEQDQVRTLTTELLREFGGVEGLVSHWRAVYANSKPGSFGRFRCLATALRLIDQVNAEDIQQEQEYSSVAATMTDGDLQASLDAMVRETIRQNPRLVLEAAEELGWEVYPPSDEG